MDTINPQDPKLLRLLMYIKLRDEPVEYLFLLYPQTIPGVFRVIYVPPFQSMKKLHQQLHSSRTRPTAPLSNLWNSKFTKGSLLIRVFSSTLPRITLLLLNKVLQHN
ncbi:hypothetical protein AAHE18_12G039700 [Arachis hypogaea]